MATLTRTERRTLCTLHGNALECRAIRSRLHSIGLRWCPTCEAVKPVAAFAAFKDGLQGRCRACRDSGRTRRDWPRVAKVRKIHYTLAAYHARRAQGMSALVAGRQWSRLAARELLRTATRTAHAGR